MIKKVLSALTAAALCLALCVSVYAEPEETEPPVTEETTESTELIPDEEEETDIPEETDPPETTTEAAPTSVSINIANLIMYVGDTYQLTVELKNPTPSSALRIYSTNIYVARSDQEGLVSATGAGTAIITAIDDATGAFDTVNVTVSERPVQNPTDIALDNEAITVTEGKTAKLTASVLPSGTSGTIVFSSDNPDIAAVDGSGNITAFKPGTANITVSISGMGISKTAVVTVTAAPVVVEYNLNLNGTIYSQNGNPGAGIKLTLNGKNSAVADTSGSFGFTALAKGKYTITAEDGVSSYTAETEIVESAHKYLLIKDGALYIEDDYGKIRSMFDILEFSLDRTSAELKPGETTQLAFSYKPEASAVNSVYYESSNPAIASVEQDGTIIAKKTGSVEITLSVNGLPEKTCTVTVINENSTENSLLIVLVESGILLAALLVFAFMYTKYRKNHSGSEE